MGWPIQEVGIAEGDVRGTQLDQTPDILQDNLLRNGEEPTPIDRWNRTMQAVMLTSTASLDISHAVPRAIALQLRVTLERR
jgi:hypothetical protein